MKISNGKGLIVDSWRKPEPYRPDGIAFPPGVRTDEVVEVRFDTGDDWYGPRPAGEWQWGAMLPGTGQIIEWRRPVVATLPAACPRLDLIPLQAISECDAMCQSSDAAAYDVTHWRSALSLLGDYQEQGARTLLLRAICYLGAAWEECASVLAQRKIRREYALAEAADAAVAALRGAHLHPDTGLPLRGHFIAACVTLWRAPE